MGPGGVFVHLGELLDGAPTDHFKVREKLGDMLAPEFIFYTVKESGGRPGTPGAG